MGMIAAKVLQAMQLTASEHC